MTTPLIDKSTWPLVHITFFSSSNVTEVDAYLAELRPIYEAGVLEPFITIADLRQVKFFKTNASVRQRLAVGLDALRTRYPRAKRGEAAVFESSMARAAFAAINLLLGPGWRGLLLTLGVALRGDVRRHA